MRLPVALLVLRWCAALLTISAAAATPGLTRPEFLIFQADISARTQIIEQNLAWIEALPADGIVLNIPASWDGTLKTTKLDYAVVHGVWLQPLVGRFPKLKKSYLLVNIRDMGDPFDDWAQVQRNWVVLVRAARDAGMKGIFFDNEYYFEPYFEYPATVKYPAKGLRAYQERFRFRGAQLMRLSQQNWANVRILHAHGPYASEPATPDRITIDQVGRSPEDMRGYFFAGMLAAARPGAEVIDGGELYQQRTAADFEAAAAWRRTGIAAVPGSTLVPPALRAAWPQKIKLGFGLYDLSLKNKYPMSPAILEGIITRALRTSDGPVWLFTESGRDYLQPGKVGPEWIAAMRRGMARAAK
jgi:hypothetical protein